MANSPDRVLLKITEVAAAAIVVAEIGLLFVAVVARYVAEAPLTWSDELASILFVWLTMLGSAIAFHRGQHMRMTAVVTRVPPGVKRWMEIAALVVPLVWLFAIAYFAFEYALEEGVVITPALEISNGWRSFALPTGVSIMIAFALARIVRERSYRDVAVALAAVAAAGVALWLAKPVFVTFGNWNLVIFFVGFIVAGVLAGIPIAFVFALSAFVYLAVGTQTPVIVLAGRMDEGMSHLILLAVPLFVFLGLQIEANGMARAMVSFLASLLGHVRGGLSYVLVGAMYLVSGISGSKTADMAAIAPALFPEMQKRGAKPGELVSLLAATGAQTETIPPSIVLITVGSVVSVSIAALFTGGLVPAMVLGAALCGVVWWRNRGEDLSGVTRATKREIWRAFLLALPALALPFVIRAAVVEGVATATEVSTIGIAYGLVIGMVVYRRFPGRDWGRMLVDTASLSGAILFIIGAATAVSWALTQSGFSQQLVLMMASLPGGAPMFLAVSIVAFIVLGSVLEGIPALVLFGPLVFPIARQFGIHEVHYAMVVILAMGIGLFIPPVAWATTRRAPWGVSTRTRDCRRFGGTCWRSSQGWCWWPPFRHFPSDSCSGLLPSQEALRGRISRTTVSGAGSPIGG